MRSVIALLYMLRLPNLAIVFLTQWVPYWLVLRPAILKAGGMPVLTARTFGLISITTVLTTLAGYIINDLYDYRMDAINRPDKVVVGKVLPAGVVMFFYLALVAAIFYLAFILDFEMRNAYRHWPLWVFPGVSFLLFLYAWQLKCTAIIGNLLVSGMCAVVPAITLLPEDRPLWLTSFLQPESIQHAIGLMWLYALFAFITNLLREQIKDLEDFVGDAKCGCATLAVVKGPRFARKPAALTGFAASIMIGILLSFWYQTGAPGWQLLAGGMLLLAPTIAATLFVFTANMRQHYRWASFFVKMVMLAGVFLLVRDWPKGVLQQAVALLPF